LLEQGNLDAVMPYICNKVRQRLSICSDALVRGEVVVFQRKDRTLAWQQVEDLKVFRIATTLGYS
jgi:polar amino acid transport system substrate-binding protein